MEILILMFDGLIYNNKENEKYTAPPDTLLTKKISFFILINSRKSTYIYLMFISYNIRDIIHNASWS